MGAYREMWKLIKQDYIVNQWIVLHINELEGGEIVKHFKSPYT
jgi:hypothetical protein